MRLLLDTHLLLWIVFRQERLSPRAARMIGDEENTLIFSTISLVEIAIKRALGRQSFQVDPAVMRRALLDSGYEELSVLGEHAVAVTDLPPLHKDPFDRLLVAQAKAEGITLLTSDRIIADYPGPIQRV